jgi:tRNA pseudouridine38-40 synthase
LIERTFCAVIRFLLAPALAEQGGFRSPEGNQTHWALLIEYDGAGFAGWQTQANQVTVQSVLEHAAAAFCGMPTACTAAGRTDAGVHAAGQVVHVSLPARFTAEQVRNAINYHAKPHRVVVVSATPAPPDWHPRFSAIARHYRYRILDRRARPALAYGQVWHVAHRLDDAAMRLGATHLLGRHDFTSFRATACQAKSPVRTLDRLDITREGEELTILVEARSFLHHQVRNMVGTLALVGAAKWHPSDVATALAARSRRAAGPTAPSEGLCLTQVIYPEPLF